MQDSENIITNVELALGAVSRPVSESRNHVTEMTSKLEESTEKDVESDEDNDDESKSENYEGFNATGRTVTLQMLMAANVLQPGKSLMTIEYLGQKFVGDLLSDGKIKSQETETVFLTPSAWAMHCKRIINPEKKSGCGWASVKYKGKKLDAYKATWLRKCALQKESTPDYDLDNETDKKLDSLYQIIKRTVFQHNTISNRNMTHDANALIEAVPFSTVNKLQPFLLNISSSSLLLADFHCHLTMHEVCGYFGGTWDVNTHTLSVIKSYPCRNTRFDRQRAVEVERQIQNSILKDQLILVGWYHSHPMFQAEPTLRDCDAQLDYQIRMRGPSEITYTPCVAVIISTYHDDNPTLESVLKPIWIVPPGENRQSVEYGRPMLMQYSLLPDKEIPEEVKTEMQVCVEYYQSFRNEMVKFGSLYTGDITYIEKLKNSLYTKFPLKQNDKALWNWICTVLDCEQEDDFIPPKTNKIFNMTNDKSSSTGIKVENVSDEQVLLVDEAEKKLEEEKRHDQKMGELKVLSLQEQLCLPSGLNMNPTRLCSPLATPNPIASVLSISPVAPPLIVQQIPAIQNLLPNNTLSNTALNSTNMVPSTISTISSPRDSPITIPSNSASPAKFEVSIRASPSPAKSDTSSHTSKTRTSPSPGKLSINDISRNSPSITPNKYEQLQQQSLLSQQPQPMLVNTLSGVPTANDLMAASLAQLAGQLPPNFLQTDIAALFQPQHRKDYCNSSLNQLAVAAAKAGNKQSLGSSTSISNSSIDQYDKNIADPNVAAAVAAYSNSFNIPSSARIIEPQQTSTKPITKQERSESRSSKAALTNNSYKTKLMKELDDLKNDPLKVSELIRSPEYASLLLQQAEALGATTLGTLGFSADFSYLTGIGANVNNTPSHSATTTVLGSKKTGSSTPLAVDYTNLLQASKMLGYDSYMQQTKNNDFNALLQQQMSNAMAPNLSSKKLLHQQQSQQVQQQQTHSDYTTLLQTYSKLFDQSNQYGSASSKSSNPHHELSALLAAGVSSAPTSSMTSGNCNSKKHQKEINAQAQVAQVAQTQQQNEMLNQLLQSEKNQNDFNALLYHQNKAAADLNALFASPLSTNVSSKIVGSGNASTVADSVNYYNALAQEKMQDYAAFFQQHHGKYSIPDPLSKTTLAANNLFMTPSALLKMQQDSLNAMMMKPPKSTSSSSRARESSASPAQERLTPTKSSRSENSGTNSGNNNINSMGISSQSGIKYNFSAVDLAISSVTSNTPSPAPSDGSSGSSRRPSNTPPVDLSRLYAELAPPTKKRMEFSSIADLAAPPSKIPKTTDREDILNLSSSD